MSKYIFGIHDPGGEALMADAPGTIVYTVNVAEDTPVDFSALSERGYRALVRLNHSHHGQGTIPPNAADWPTFAETCALFVAGCRGVRDFTLGNEPNLQVEWGRDEPVLPEQYAACYNLVHAAVKARKPSAQLSPAAIGPWNLQSGVEWVTYFRRMLDAIPHSHIDFLTLHAYSRGYAPTSITDNARMDRPHHTRFNGFRAYKDFLEVVPAGLRDRPVDIKESNGNEPWPDQNTGWVQAAYAEIHRHNAIVGTQKIRTLAMFRWAHFDTRWDFSTKNGVHADFRAAVANKYAAPHATVSAPTTPPPTIKLPTVSAGPVVAEPARDIDERLRQRGMGIKGADVQPGQPYWRLVRAVWMDEREAGGRHHIYVDALDEQGQRVPGVEFGVTWPSGAAMITTEAKPGEEWAGNFPMSPSRNEFSIRPMETGDAVNGIGMGADMGDGFNSNFHTSTGLVFQRSRARDTHPQPAIPAQNMYVNSPDGLQVRSHPRVDSQKIIGLPHGEKVTVYETHADTAGHDRLWARVNGGWVAHWLLSETAPEPVPVAPHPPQAEPQPEPPAQPQDKWERSYAFTARWEGGYQNVHNDRGNWTGGQVGVGELKGTNWGISAASYPYLDIRNLTKEQAKQIYFRDYWQASGADKLDWPGCLILFDTAVLHGVGRARQWVQEAGTNPLHFAARRLRSYVGLDNWHFWGAAWTKRVADLLEEAAK